MATGTIKKDCGNMQTSTSATANTTYVGTVHTRVLKKNDLTKQLILNFNLVSGNIPNEAVLFTLPDEYKPLINITVPAFVNGNLLCPVWITTDGEVKTNKAVTGTNYVTCFAHYF